MTGALEFRGKHLELLNDRTAEILAEGSLSSGKTTVGIWKELQFAVKYPGIWILITRWTDDACKTLLRPAIEQLGRVHGTALTWNNAENYYALENGSRIFCFGLKTQSSDPLQKFSKIRGLPVSRILVDQAEQIGQDVVGELRFRLRPDIEARLRGVEYPRQLTFLANPVPDSHVLAKEFPISNKIKNRVLYSFSLLDNAHVLPPEMVESLYATYPPEHPFHATKILGQRGLSVSGDAVFDNLFDPKAHIRELQALAKTPILEGFTVGKHNPCWIVAQRTAYGGMNFLGGIMGKRMMLDDFLPIIDERLDRWFGPQLDLKTCTAPMGEHENQSGARYTLLTMLRAAGRRPIWRENANAHDVQLAMLEEIGALLRRRVRVREEALGVSEDPDRWLYVMPDGSIETKPFLSFAFQGGAVWSDHFVSVSNKEMRQMHEDDEYANAMHCVENLVLNFAAGQRTPEEKALRRRNRRGFSEPRVGTSMDYMG